MNHARRGVRVGASGLLALLLLGNACGGRNRSSAVSSAEECRAVESRIAANTPWDSLPGSWRLTLVSPSGTAGQSVQGTMTLHAQEAALRRVERAGATAVSVPVIGATDIALEQVGAVRLGDLNSTAPNQPGLAIWVSEATDGNVSAVLRIGQEAIHSDLLRFDGGYTALYLRQVSANSIRGDWASGVTRKEASGYFCADRVGV